MRGAAVLWLVLGGMQEGAPEEARVRRLVEALRADYLQDREAARKELEGLGPSATRKVLIEGLGHPDFRVRRTCLEILAAFGEAGVVDQVGEIFRTDEDPQVREAAFAFLKAAGRPAARHLLGALESKRVEHRREAARILVELRCPEAAAAMAALFENDPDRDVRDRAFEYLRKAGGPARPYLIRLLTHADPAVRRGALEGLRAARGGEKDGDREVLEAVGRTFRNETDNGVLRAAFDYLLAAGSDSEEIFLEGLRSRSSDVRGLSLEGLQELRSERALDPAGRLFLQEDSEEVRARACGYLRTLGKKAEEIFLQGLASGHPQVRLMSIPALGEIGSLRPLDRIGSLYREDRDPAIRRAAFEYLRGLGKPAEPFLILALREGDRRTRLEAVETLGRIRSVAAVEPLMAFLEGLDPELRKAAGEAVVRIGGPAAEEAVRQAAAAGRIPQRVASELLAFMDQVEVERVLGELITPGGSRGWFPGMFRGLESIGREKGVPILVRMATERGFPWRLEEDRRGSGGDWARKMQGLAVMALGEWGDATAGPALRSLWAGISRTPGEGPVEELVVALYRLGDREPYEEFLRQMSDGAEAALRGERVDEGCGYLFQLGLVQGRVGHLEEAERTYRRLLEEVAKRKATGSEREVVASALYNLACLAARRGRTSEALEWLREAVGAGFRDRDWILRDRELDPLRGESGYRELLEDDRLRPAK